ncbi:MAG: FG-GAP repeat domain-containing protein, partial [Candidatus Zixiibacteriota bacterium]
MSAKSIYLLTTVIICFFSNTAGQVPVEQTPFWSTSELGLYSTGMVWRDGNNDGYIDVFYSNGNDMALARNTVYLSQHGVMTSSASWFSNNYEYSGHCGVGDIDDDGRADFLVANYLGAGRFATGNYGNLYLNSLDFLSLTPDWYNADSIYSFSCALGDADGDGDLDAAFATGEGYNSIYENDLIFYNVNGALNPSPGWQSAYGTAALDVGWGDINNDGWLDLAFCYSDGAPATLYYNNAGVIETAPSWQSNYSDPSNTLMFGDINGDGWLDLILADNNQLGGSGRFRVYFNDGAGNLDPEYGWQSGQGGYGSALALYDYDNDGDDDLATGRWFNRVTVYENTGTTFTTSPVWESGPSMVAEELAWVDIDGDGIEQRRDVFYATGGKKLFYTAHHPLQAIDSVIVDGSALADADFCYDLFYGWVSMGTTPADSVEIFYQYSFKCDLTVANWDTCNMAFANTNRPLVDMYAEPLVGWAPLTVQFYDSTAGASDWLWRFDETDSATIQNPERTYTEGGIYDIYLENTQP